jgi:uncharacterized protein (DUF1501 family)
MQASVPEVMDISREPQEVLDAYGAKPGSPSLANNCLLARRLVEEGVRFVHLFDWGWDFHGTNPKEDIRDGLTAKMAATDKPVAALINDLDARGLLETTMVIALGEFGRTPKLSTLPGQTKAGRDHWASAMSIRFAGGGAPGGQVIGATDRLGHSASERVLSPENFVSTVYTKLGIDPSKSFLTPAGRPTFLVSDPTPIRELF